MKTQINRVNVYWFGEDRNLLVFGYALPNSDMWRPTKKLLLTTAELERFLLVDSICVYDSSGQLHLSLSPQGSKQVQEHIRKHLECLRSGTAIRYTDEPEIDFEFHEN